MQAASPPYPTFRVAVLTFCKQWQRGITVPFILGVQVPAQGTQPLDIGQGEVPDNDHCVALLQAELVPQAVQGSVSLSRKVLPGRLLQGGLPGYSGALCCWGLQLSCRQRLLPLPPVGVLQVKAIVSTGESGSAHYSREAYVLRLSLVPLGRNRRLA